MRQPDGSATVRRAVMDRSQPQPVHREINDVAAEISAKKR
jgi:hypothetical protein